MELKKTPKADLQNKKTLFFEIGLCASLLLTLLAFNRTTRESAESVLFAPPQEIIEEEERVPITQQEPPPPPEAPKIPQIPDIIEIVEDDVDISDNFDFSESESNDLFQDLAYVDKKQVTLVEEKEEDEIIPFAVVEEKPKFQGKDAEEFRKWINTKLANNYPQAAVENNLQGKVYVSFTVNIDGSLSDIRSMRKTDPILEECVIDLVKKSPKWTPGRQQNKPVKVTYQIPVIFKLQQ
jgi:protein TonB